MAPDVSRTLAVALVALALALSASLLPAAGVGSHPAGPPGGSADGSGQADTTTVTATPSPTADQRPVTDAPDTPTSTPTPDRSNLDDDEADDAADSSDSTETPTPSPTSTDEPAADDTNDDNDGSIFVSFGLVGAFTLLLIGAARAMDTDPDDSYPDSGQGGWSFGFLDRLRFGTGWTSGGLSRATLAYVVGLSRGAPGLFDSVGRAFSETTTGLSVVFRGTATGLGGLFSGSASGFASGLGGLASALGSIPGSLPSLSGSTSGGEDEPAATDARDHGPAPEQAEADTGPVSIEEAWAAFEESAPVRAKESRTPLEFAIAAIEAGFPREPVVQLTAVFQEVTYGGLARTEQRIEKARRAFAAITSYREGDDA